MSKRVEVICNSDTGCDELVWTKVDIDHPDSAQSLRDAEKVYIIRKQVETN